MSLPHPTRPVQVWVDADLGIAEMVERLNTIPGVRTLASCQGTLGEGGPSPYRPQVMATWPAEQEARLRAQFDVTPLGECWGYLHPRPLTSEPGDHIVGEKPTRAAQVEGRGPGMNKDQTPRTNNPRGS